MLVGISGEANQVAGIVATSPWCPCGWRDLSLWKAKVFVVGLEEVAEGKDLEMD